MSQTDVKNRPALPSLADLESLLAHGETGGSTSRAGAFGINASKSARRGVNAKKDKRTRKQIRFWLDLESVFEAGIANVLHNWRLTRVMETSIVQALRLYIACESGRYEVLFDMYPDVREMCGKKRR